MRTKILVGSLLVGLLAFGYGLSANPQPAEAQNDYKNLKVLDKNISKKDLKKLMKSYTKALGVKCDHCHQTPDFTADTEHKEFARKMIKMTNEANKKYFKGKKKQVTCNTCHMGKPEPENY